MELDNISTMLKEHKCICSRSKEFIPDTSLHIEGLSAILSKEWTEKVESSSSIIQIYRGSRILLCSIGDATPLEIFYDLKVRVNVMSKILANHIALEEPLTFSLKNLKWIEAR